jgi:thiol-disulfide isomerase/thioredoxin
LNVSFSTDNEIEKKYLLCVSIPEYKKGYIKINSIEHNVFLSNCFTRADYLKERVSVFIVPKTQNISELKDEIPYKIGDIFNVKGFDYSIDSITKWGDKLFIQYIGKNERPEGISEGYYLPKFDAKYIDNSDFELAKYSGKYLLLDFWGTWCVPCIKLIPELKKLNSDFSDKNFALISVAYDESPNIVTDFVVKENMNWAHLFVDSNQYAENSVISKLKINKYPTTILISPDGKIVGRDLEIDDLRKLLIEKLKDR